VSLLYCITVILDGDYHIPGSSHTSPLPFPAFVFAFAFAFAATTTPHSPPLLLLLKKRSTWTSIPPLPLHPGMAATRGPSTRRCYSPPPRPAPHPGSRLPRRSGSSTTASSRPLPRPSSTTSSGPAPVTLPPCLV
jgi:hypothetical protein